MFQGRDAGYVAGAMLILSATTVSTAGIVSPGWLHFLHPSPDNLTTMGLFLECRNSQEACKAVDLLEVKSYEMWSHVIISIGVFSLLISSLFVFVFNCSSDGMNRRLKVIEGCAVYGGFFILIGIVNYVANDKHTSRSSYSYSFFLTVLSSLLAVAGGVLVALHNRAPPVLTADLMTTEEGGEQGTRTKPERPPDTQRDSDEACNEFLNA